MTEKEIENAILTYLNLRPDCFAFKVNTVGVFDSVKKVYRKSNNKFAVNGVSDIIAQFDGLGTVFIEVKTPKGRQSDAQKAFENSINRYNGNYFIARGLDDIKKIILDLQESREDDIC